MNAKDGQIDAEMQEAYQEWQRARTTRQPYPQLIVCEDDDTCPGDHEHNPLPGYEHHVYGCECDGCIRWYRSLK